jgi:hypothetical protein
MCKQNNLYKHIGNYILAKSCNNDLQSITQNTKYMDNMNPTKNSDTSGWLIDPAAHAVPVVLLLLRTR